MISVIKELYRIKGTLLFETAFHIGSGKGAEGITDMPVLKNPDGKPLLPGSTLKGKFRATVEKLATHLNLTACMLDSSASNFKCIGDEKIRRDISEEYKKQTDFKNREEWLKQHRCKVCHLFGSSFEGSRIFFSDGTLISWSDVTQIRDGVVIDRDTETARPKLKFDYEVVPSGASYTILIELENPDENDKALVALGLQSWQTGVLIGGNTSRGLGRALLTDIQIERVRFENVEERKEYILHRKFASFNYEDFIKDSIEPLLRGGKNA